jgi:hypothetical protein
MSSFNNTSKYEADVEGSVVSLISSSFGNQKSREPVSQQMWNDKDPSLLKGLSAVHTPKILHLFIGNSK